MNATGANIQGGAGGAGGNYAGAGGNGGVGISGADFTVTNSGQITGGNGGNGGNSTALINSIQGIGGIAIASTGGSTIIEDGSSSEKKAIIQGGLPGGATPGSTYADAIQFSGGGNTLELDNPYYTINGNVISSSGIGAAATNGGDTLELAGTATNATVTGTFSNSATATPAFSPENGPTYAGFNNLVKTGTGTWMVSNTATDIPNWTIQQGILVVNGNYDPTASSSLGIAITPQDTTPGVDYGQLQVTGSATLKGTLKILNMTQLVTGAPGGTYGNATYQLITTTSGVSGAFSGVSYDPNFASYIKPVVSTSGKNEILTLTAQNSDFSTGDAAPASLYVNQEGLNTASQTVLGGSQGILGTGCTMRFTATHIGPWAKGFGGFGRSNGFSVYDYGGVAGYGAAINPNLVLGGAFSGSGTETSNPYETASGQSFGFYGYGIYTQGKLRISGDMGTGYLSLDTHRNLLPTALQASGSTDGWFLGVGTQLQYLIPLGSAFLMPYGDLSYLHTAYGAFTDQGAGSLDLTTAGMRTNIGSLTGGLRAGINLQGSGFTWIPWVEVGGTGNTGSLHTSVLQTVGGLAGNNTNVARLIVTPGGTLDTGAGLTVKGTGPWSVKAAYQGQFLGADAHFNTFDLLANYRW